jgi:hypothetical protein
VTVEIAPTPVTDNAPPPPPRMWRRHCKFDELQPGDSIVLCNDVVWHDTRIVISVEPGTESDHFVLRTKDENGIEVPPTGAHYATDCVWLVERRTDATDAIRRETNLERHAIAELSAAGLLDKGSDYEGMIGETVMRLIRAFNPDGDHSGGSAKLALEVFDRVARFRALGPLTNHPNEWMQVSPDMMPDGSPTVWQNKRHSSAFSNDGGKTYYDIDEPTRVVRPTFDPAFPHKESTIDQPPPVANDARPTWELVVEMCERWSGEHPTDGKVIADMRERDRVGRERYGTPLQPNNGRNSIADAYAEGLDFVAYLTNAIIERKLNPDDMGHQLGDILWRVISFCSVLREEMDNDAAATRPAGT